VKPEGAPALRVGQAATPSVVRAPGCRWHWLPRGRFSGRLSRVWMVWTPSRERCRWWRSSAHVPATVRPPDRGCRCVNGCGLRSSCCSARRRLQEAGTALNDTWYSRDLPVLTAIAEKLERGSAPVDTEQLIDELGLTRQDLTAALRALDVEYLIVKWPERITYRRSDPATLVERITSRAREAVGLWPSTEARQTAQRQPGHDQE
jgi:DNA-binding MarR family transcriptional regulator